MKNKISDDKFLKGRIYYKDKLTNEIGFLDMKLTDIYMDEIDSYLKINHKNFMYCTKIRCEQKKK